MKSGIQPEILGHIFDNPYLDGTPFHWLQAGFETVPSTTAAASATRSQACSSGTDRRLDAAAVAGGTEGAGDCCSSIAISSSLNATDRKSWWFMKGYFHGTRHFSDDVALIDAAFRTWSGLRFGNLGDNTALGRSEPVRHFEAAGSAAAEEGDS